ncbi:hypothetical protein M409DRAFT_25991 [Zasmidium cellare ATCC 36951]|uniref:WSC domain-containing protein n=1 Tax=Zasmidium cellare ATCC 36951 TaxID=1080233 RepID=A0A6A6CC70_ZASCE|nr:uncharacterized protein M409DRAFT_25991 [Zasmidium cellare ATCC 36951]KAF2163810.1 hypothetical protein M409DRAFT_25991 [Zasmidium cellare ATCC 36951]
MSRLAAIGSFILLVSQCTATLEQRQNSVSIDGQTCPNGWLDTIYNGNRKCCPGAVYNTDDNVRNEDSAYCCVGATFSVATASFSSCFPFCSGTDDGNGVTVAPTSKMPCSATVMLTDADYSSKVSSASASISGSSGAMTTGGSGGSSGSSSGSAAAQTGSSSSSSAGAAMVTSGPLAGALMIAGGLLFV